MEKEIIIVVDPRGRVVHLPASLCIPNGKSKGAYLDALQTAIQAPACMIEASSQELFYFRSIGWDITILIRVILQDGIWKATACTENPDPEFIQEQLKEGSFIAGTALN